MRWPPLHSSWWSITLAVALAVFAALGHADVSAERRQLGTTWDLDAPCQPHIRTYARALAAMTECAANFSSPPKVCTNCIDEYIHFRETEYATRHLTNVTSLDNRTCADIFYSSYAVSYAAEIATSLTHRVWENSRCQSCLRIDWQLEKRNSTIEYDAKTLDFERRLLQWRECVNEFGERPRPQNATICAACGALFDGLFDYYWRIYKAPGIDFCLDVESTMNDTMSIWHAVWGCADEHTDTKHYDITIVAFSATFLALVICLFYAGSYIQIEHAQRHSVRYSRLQPPQGTRSRLLSSSTVDDYAYTHTPASSLHG